MVSKKKSKPQVTQGGINITGNVTIKNSRVAGRDNVERNTSSIHLSFAPVYQTLNENTAIDAETKKSVEESVKQIEKEVQKGEKAKPSFIQQRLENIEKMAPDIAEVLITTLQNPALGVSLAVKKVINKMEAEKAS